MAEDSATTWRRLRRFVPAALSVLTWQLRDAHAGAATRLAELGQQVEELRKTVNYFRFERGTGGGPTALIEQLRFWAPKLQLASTPAAEMPEVERRVRDLHDGIASLGKQALPELQKAFDASTGDSEDEFRRQLLVALGRADAEYTKALLAKLVHALEVKASPRLRLMAADELIRVDKALAGTVLRNVLETQSSRGVRVESLPPEMREKLAPAMLAARDSSGFFNLVSRYLATGDPATDDTLQMLLGRQEQDRMTMLECIKALGAHKVKAALPRIQELFASPPTGVRDDALFRNHCLDAIAAIEGSAAHRFFDAALREEKNEIVQAKLQDLLKRVR